MNRTTRTLTTAALVALLAAPTAGVALARSGGGPLTTVAGTYRLVDATGAGPWSYSPPSADHSFTLGGGLRVEVIALAEGDDAWCVQPDTREVRRADPGHHAECTTPAPDAPAGVPTGWARPATP